VQLVISSVLILTSACNLDATGYTDFTGRVVGGVGDQTRRVTAQGLLRALQSTPFEIIHRATADLRSTYMFLGVFRVEASFE
jgi:hypothetical protein